MGTHLSETVFRQFLSTGQDMIEGRLQAHICSDKKAVMSGLDLDATHRAFRIMEKHGLMANTKRGNENYFSITPKGIAVIDFFMMTLAKPS